jgi:hypothetical protein
VVGVEEARDGDLEAIAGVELGGPQLDDSAGIDEAFQPVRGHSSIGKKSYAKVQRGGVAENPVMEMPSKPGDFGLFRPASRHGGIL